MASCHKEKFVIWLFFSCLDISTAPNRELSATAAAVQAPTPSSIPLTTKTPGEITTDARGAAPRVRICDSLPPRLNVSLHGFTTTVSFPVSQSQFSCPHSATTTLQSVATPPHNQLKVGAPLPGIQVEYFEQFMRSFHEDLWYAPPSPSSPPSLFSYLTPCFSLILFSPSPFPLFFPSFPLSTQGMTYIVTSGDLL